MADSFDVVIKLGAHTNPEKDPALLQSELAACRREIDRLRTELAECRAELAAMRLHPGGHNA